ncbi:MAG TPA: type II toxin-antitoxin system RelE/ParE family toxin [Candidatus Nanopelagicaceae bacterium]|nr:type II toxin-antitoxin system RelE/ParE family toxin [Candidatus Nanopelagicaceae bacterium]
MTYSIEFSPSATKALAKFDKHVYLRISGAIELLAVDPRPPAAKMLRGGEHGRWRVRVGDYRIVYTITDERLIVLVLRVAHRREVYNR